MSSRTRDNRGKTPCRYCSLPFNNFNIGRHLRLVHNIGNAGSQSPKNPPTNESSSSSDGDTDDSDSDERNDIECTYRANESGVNELDASSAHSADSDTDESNDIEDNNDNFPEDDNDEDEAEKTVENYIREMTDETFRTEIGYDPKRILKYLSWQRQPRLTPIQQEAHLSGMVLQKHTLMSG
jgi:hypothetical protein